MERREAAVSAFPTLARNASTSFCLVFEAGLCPCLSLVLPPMLTQRPLQSLK